MLLRRKRLHLRGMAGHEQIFHRSRSRYLDQVGALPAPGYKDIRDEEIERFLLELRLRLGESLGVHHLVSGLLEQLREQRADLGMVFDEEDALHGETRPNDAPPWDGLDLAARPSGQPRPHPRELV